MLVLTRRPDEKLIIGDDITITIISVKGNQVRIGIDAPKNLKCLRAEIVGKPIKPKIETKITYVGKPVC